ncbi:MAG: response regulator with CheY-like receiver, AAA-type ATPase, and DNA-binding domain [Deltaproteobacteria bacterium]|nr:response regulator with CheY-like receiver, AAA-type ATPase, and DNA-binding domain [Deltaproteobacteria bacterium]
MTTPTPTGAPINILVVDDESNIRKTLAICLEAEGHRVTGVSNFKDAVAEASRRTFHMAFVDLRLGVESGLDLIPALLTGSPWMKIVVITAYASIDTAVEAMRRGATDYIPKPFTPAQVLLAVRKVEEVRAQPCNAPWKSPGRLRLPTPRFSFGVRAGPGKPFLPARSTAGAGAQGNRSPSCRAPPCRRSSLRASCSAT